MKKLLGIILATMLIAATFVANAAAVPSKTAEDLTQVMPLQGAPAQVFIVEDGPAVVSATAVQTAIANIVATGAPAVSFFPPETQASIAGTLPVGLPAADLELNELLPLSFSGYTAGSGDILLPIQFATAYQDGQTLVPVLGIVQADGSIEWHVLTATVSGGIVTVTIPGDVAALIGNKPVVLAMLSK